MDDTPVGPQTEAGEDGDGRQKGQQRSREPSVDVVGHHDDHEHRNGDADRPTIDLAQLIEHVSQYPHGGGTAPGNPKDRR